MYASQAMSRTQMLFVPTTVKISEKHRLLMEERELELRMEAFKTRAQQRVRVLASRLSRAEGTVSAAAGSEGRLPGGSRREEIGRSRFQTESEARPEPAGAGRRWSPSKRTADPTQLQSHLLLKTKHRFLGESAVSRQGKSPRDLPLTTQIVVGQTYHKSANLTMAKRKIRAFYRQFVGTFVDLLGD